MDEFILSIDKEKFRSTNAKWNKLMLNDPWSVGYVSTLIETANWKNKEEWETTYYLLCQRRSSKSAHRTKCDKIRLFQGVFQ